MKFQKFKTLKTETLIDNKFCHIEKQRIELPDKSQVDWFLRKSLGAVVILPLLDNGQIMLQKTYKHGCGEVLYEFPAGMIDKGEIPEEAAKRELLEETGFETQELVFLGKAFPDPTGSNSVHHYFLAKNCKKVAEQELEPAEQIELLYFANIKEVSDFLRKNKTTNTALSLLSLNGIS